MSESDDYDSSWEFDVIGSSDASATPRTFPRPRTPRIPIMFGPPSPTPRPSTPPLSLRQIIPTSPSALTTPSRPITPRIPAIFRTSGPITRSTSTPPIFLIQITPSPPTTPTIICTPTTPRMPTILGSPIPNPRPNTPPIPTSLSEPTTLSRPITPKIPTILCSPRQTDTSSLPSTSIPCTITITLGTYVTPNVARAPNIFVTPKVSARIAQTITTTAIITPIMCSTLITPIVCSTFDTSTDMDATTGESNNNNVRDEARDEAREMEQPNNEEQPQQEQEHSPSDLPMENPFEAPIEDASDSDESAPSLSESLDTALREDIDEQFVMPSSAYDNMIHSCNLYARPLSMDAINNLIEQNISEVEVQNKLECCICREFFILNEPARKLKCSHFYHFDCIRPWLQIRGNCPLCRCCLHERNASSVSRSPFSLFLGNSPMFTVEPDDQIVAGDDVNGMVDDFDDEDDFMDDDSSVEDTAVTMDNLQFNNRLIYYLDPINSDSD